jgi:hypothetical protein
LVIPTYIDQTLWYLFQAVHRHREGSIHRFALPLTHLVNRFPQAINTTQRLMLYERIPRVQLIFSSQKTRRLAIKASCGGNWIVAMVWYGAVASSHTTEPSSVGWCSGDVPSWIFVRCQERRRTRSRLRQNLEFVLRAVLCEIFRQPVAECFPTVTTLHLFGPVFHIIENGEERHVTIVVTESESALRVERMADHVGVW